MAWGERVGGYLSITHTTMGCTVKLALPLSGFQGWLNYTPANGASSIVLPKCGTGPTLPSVASSERQCQLCAALSSQLSVVTGAMDFNTDYSYMRAMDTDIALHNRSGWHHGPEWQCRPARSIWPWQRNSTQTLTWPRWQPRPRMYTLPLVMVQAKTVIIGPGYG